MVRENFHRLLLLIALIIVVSSLAVSIVEPDITPINGIWWTIVTMTTVGYGDISPHTIGGRIIAVVVMLFGIGLLGMFSASVASIMVQHKLREERGLSTYRFQNHIILCEWNHRTAAILASLRSDPKTAQQGIVLIADLASKPVEDENLFFVAGSVNDETLTRANLAQAQTVVVMGDDRLEPTARDAKVVLAVLTIESINRRVYTIVELVSDTNVRHCQRAGANEIIVNNDVSSGLVARAALDHGITKVISDWLSLGSGDELYKVDVPARYIGKTLIDVLFPMKQQHGCLVIGVQRGVDGDVLANPPADYRLASDDQLIVVCADRPNLE
jgi:voltage-gated potassium channel